MLRFFAAVLAIAAAFSLHANQAQAQITSPRVLSASTNRFASLQEQLTNRLRATTQDKKDYLARVVTLVRQGKLDTRLIIAIERYALKRHPAFPFPYFERALRFEASKRGVVVPTVQQVRASNNPFNQP